MKIEIVIPEGYRWVAIQPWGEMVAFKRRPRIVNDGTGNRYWGLQDGELPITDLGNKTNWRDSLHRI